MSSTAEVPSDDCRYFEDFWVGQTRQFCRYVLKRDQIENYAAAFGPLFGGRDETVLGKPITASPWQLCGLLMRLNYDGWMRQAAAHGAPGVDEVRWFRRVAAGETLSARYTVRNARVSRSKPYLGLIQYYYELLGDDRRPVLSQLNSVMMLRKTPQKAADEPARGAQPSVTSNIIPDPDNKARVTLGSVEFRSEDILAFARTYDPQPFHVDPIAAIEGPFGALAASGWHTAAAWSRAYAQCFASGTKPLPRPRDLLWLKPLHWRRPVFAGDRITFDFSPLTRERAASGETVVISQNRGVNSSGVTVIEFTLAMTVADK